MSLLVRDTTEAPWREILGVGQEDALGTQPLAFSENGNRLLAESSAGSNTSRLVWLECTDGSESVVVEDPQYDVAGVRLHPDTNDPQIALILKDRMDYVVLDPAIRDDLELLRELEPGDLVFAGNDDADRTWLVGYTADNGPIRYYAYDRVSHEATFLFEHQPALSDFELARMEPFSFESRDGLTIHGYLTFPPGADRQGLPAVLDVHGGPWGRDTWGFNPETQWLANRGYLSVQVNFRGSTGYGKRFVNAGDREWGAKMHDDLLDAVAWVTAEGYADPERIAIYGGSYGGYAALVGAAFTPDVFRCAVDIVGPSNLKTLIESIPPYWAPMIAQFHTRVGNPETEADFLWERSPLSRVGRHPHSPADRPGRERPAGETGRERADRRGAPRQGHPPRIHAVPRRGARLRKAREPAALLRRGRALPRRASRREIRAVRRRGTQRRRRRQPCRGGPAERPGRRAREPARARRIGPNAPHSGRRSRPRRAVEPARARRIGVGRDAGARLVRRVCTPPGSAGRREASRPGGLRPRALCDSPLGGSYYFASVQSSPTPTSTTSGGSRA